MTDKPQLPPGWEWDPEGVGADQYEGDFYSPAQAPSASAGPTEETMQRVIQEVVDEAWAIYRKRWAEALAEGEKVGIRKGLELAADGIASAKYSSSEQAIGGSVALRAVISLKNGPATR